LSVGPKKEPTPFGVGSFLCVGRFERSNATRASVAGDGLTEPNLYFSSVKKKNANKSASSGMPILNWRPHAMSCLVRC